MEEIKPIFGEKQEFHYRDKSILMERFDSWGYQDSDARIKVVLKESYSKKPKFSNATLIEEIKALVTEKRKVE